MGISDATIASSSANDERRKRLNRIFRLVTLIGVLAFTAAGAVGAEMWARHYERTREVPPDYFPSIYYPHRRLRYGLIPGIDYFGWFRINSMGFRGREFSLAKSPGTVRIVCLGGSTTFDIGAIGADKPWPEILEEDLRGRFPNTPIEVLNFGIGGATSLDSLIDLQTRALSFDPDVVIVYQGHNDLVYSIPPAGPMPPSDLYPDEDRPRSRVERWLTYNSLLYAKTSGRISEAIHRIVTLPTRVLGLESDSEGTVLDRDEEMAKGLTAYRRNIQAIAAIARANDVVLVLPEVLVPFPQPGRECRRCEALESAYGGVPVEKLREMFKRYNEVLQAAANPSEGIYYIRTEGFVPSSDEYYNDAVHFSGAGSRLMGQHMSSAVIDIVRSVAENRLAN